MNVHNCLQSLENADGKLLTLQSQITDHYYSESPMPTDEEETRLLQAGKYISLALDHIRTAGVQLAEVQRQDHVESDNANGL